MKISRSTRLQAIAIVFPLLVFSPLSLPHIPVSFSLSLFRSLLFYLLVLSVTLILHSLFPSISYTSTACPMYLSLFKTVAVDISRQNGLPLVFSLLRHPSIERKRKREKSEGEQLSHAENDFSRSRVRGAINFPRRLLIRVDYPP